MKKVENQTSVAMVMKSFFQNEWPGFEFAEKALLIRTKDIDEGPAWMETAVRGNEKVVFILETVTKYAYVCPIQFAYDEVVPSTEKPEEIKDNKGMTGIIAIHNCETAIIWE